jgi:hypothetical protein
MKNIVLSQEKKHIFILILAYIILIIITSKIPYKSAPFKDWDLQYYMEMAEYAPHISLNIPRPFFYRILGPYLIGLLPLSVENAFYYSTIILCPFAIILLYLLLIKLDIDRKSSFIATLCFLLNPYGLTLIIWDYFQINDLIAYIFFILLFCYMYKGQYLYYCLALALAILAREFPLMMIPATFVFLLERKKYSTIPKFIASIIPCLLIFLIFRLAVPAEGPSYWYHFKLYYTDIFHIEYLLRIFFNAWGPIVAFFIFYYKKAAKILLAKPHMITFIVCIYFAALWGFSAERLVIFSFVAVYYLLAKIITDAKVSKVCIYILIGLSIINNYHQTYSRIPLTLKTTIIIHVLTPPLMLLALIIHHYRKSIPLLKKFA